MWRLHKEVYVNLHKKFITPIFGKQVYDGQVCGSGGCGSSNESSSDSSTSSPPLSPTPEHALPGVVSFDSILRLYCFKMYTTMTEILLQLFSQGSWYLPFVLSLEHIGISKRFGPLTEAAHLLSQICPPHKQTVCILWNVRNVLFHRLLVSKNNVIFDFRRRS